MTHKIRQGYKQMLQQKEQHTDNIRQNCYVLTSTFSQMT